MRSLYQFLVALTFLCLGQARACEHSLVGTWKSDGPRSMDFVENNSKLQPNQEAFLGALLGHMTMTFAHGEIHLVMPDVEVPVKGQLRHFAGFEERKPYKVLFCGRSQIVWSAKRSFGTEDDTTTFQFVNADTVWIYMGSTALGVPDLNAREYFHRIQ